MRPLVLTLVNKKSYKMISSVFKDVSSQNTGLSFLANMYISYSSWHLTRTIKCPLNITVTRGHVTFARTLRLRQATRPVWPGAVITFFCTVSHSAAGIVKRVISHPLPHLLVAPLSHLLSPHPPFHYTFPSLPTPCPIPSPNPARGSGGVL